jgi:hypothetical protein
VVYHLAEFQTGYGSWERIQVRVREEPLRREIDNLTSTLTAGGQQHPLMARPLGERGRSYEYRTTRSGGGSLTAREAENRDIAQAAERLVPKRASGALRRILDHGYSLLSRELADADQVGGISVEVRNDYRIDAASDRRAD